MRRISFYFILISILMLSCEPDDICIEGTPGTPTLIVVFYDKDAPNTAKAVSGLQVKGVNNEVLLYDTAADSIALPLKTGASMSSFSLKKTENEIEYEALLEVNYTTSDQFISRACGFKTTFEIVTILDTKTNSWIENIETTTNSISDTKQSHVKILH